MHRGLAAFALLSASFFATDAWSQPLPESQPGAEPPVTAATATLDTLATALPAVEDDASTRADAESRSLSTLVLQLGVGANHSYISYSADQEGTAETGRDPLGLGATAAAAYRMGFAMSWALQLRGVLELAPFGAVTVTDEIDLLSEIEGDRSSGMGVLLLADVGLLNQPALSGSFHWAVSLTAGLIFGSGETVMTKDISFTELALGGTLDLAFWLDRSHTWELGLRTSMVAPIHFGSHLTVGYAL